MKKFIKISHHVISFAAIAITLIIGIYIWNEARFQSYQTEDVFLPHDVQTAWTVIHALYSIAFYKIVLINGWILLSVILLVKCRQIAKTKNE